MNIDTNLISYFLHAGPVVKCVMLILLLASIFSWSTILQRYFYVREVRKATERFEDFFWSGEDLAALYSGRTSLNIKNISGVEAVFRSGFKEFVRFRKQTEASLKTVMNNTKRAMQAAKIREQAKLESSLSFLAIVASTSPYIGLFGTVWGIMQSFQALSLNTQQATLASVAPGIAEALIATALGLFAAIPAVIAYNRFVAEISRLLLRFDTFQEEFTNILFRQAMQQNKSVKEEMHTGIGA